MVIFLYGEDGFISREKLTEIKNKFLSYDKSGSGLSSFDAEEKFSANDVVNVLETPNLLNPKRLVILKNIISNASESDQEKILKYLSKNKGILESQNTVAVFWEGEKVKANNKLFKYLEKSAKKQKFEKMTGVKLNIWIQKRIKSIDESESITPGAIQKLIIFSGSDTGVLDKEILKLVNFNGGKEITEEDVDTVVNSKVESDIFSTIDAISQNNKKRALELVHNHLEKGEDPFYLFSMIVYQFRNLLKVSGFKDQGMFNEYEIAKSAKLHPFVVKKSLAQLRNFTSKDIVQIYLKLQKIDVDVKTGKKDLVLAMDVFIAEL
jgi:DNA polymerase III subunit delta